MIFSVDLKDTYFQIPIHPDSRPYHSGESVSIPGFLFRPVVGSPGLHQSFLPCVGVGSSKGISSAWYMDDWLVVAESLLLLFCHCDLLLQLCWDLEIVVNWEESDLEPSMRTQYLAW